MPTALTSQIDPHVITEQLKRVLASPQFSETTRMKRFLSHLVTETLAGRADELKGYALGLDVFDKPDDFDPGIDTIVRVQANKLRSRLDLYYGQDGRNDPVRIHVPKGTYSPVFEIAFDAENSTDAALPDVGPGGRTSLAVMPFDNLSGDPDQEYLADGFTEEVIAAIARFREVSVLSRHVTFRFRNRARDPREIGRDLDVDYLVEGSVRHWDGNLRVTAQLVDANTGEQMSSDTYDRDLQVDGLFDVQEDIAARIATEIAEPHGVIHRTGTLHRQRAGTTKFDAYQCRLLATEYWRQPTAAQHARVRDLLEKAVRIDPDYAGAWGMLAIIYGDEIRAGYNIRKHPPPLDRALDAAERSVRRDPMNATGQHALFLTHYHRGNFELYETAAQKALRANPNYPDMLADMALCEGLRGNRDQSFALIRRAIELSPNPPGWYQAVTCVLNFQHGNDEVALTAARQIGDAMWHGPELLILMCLGQLNRTEDAAQLIERMQQKLPNPHKFLSNLLNLWHVPDALATRMDTGLRNVGAL